MSTQERPPLPAATWDRPSEGHGRRLTAAFEALEAFPALAESRNRVLRIVREDRTSHRRRGRRGRVRRRPRDHRAADGQRPGLASARARSPSVPEAVELLTPEGVEQLASRARGLRLLRAHARAGTSLPSASACTRSPPRPPPTGSPARSTTRSATSCSPRRCCTTSASSCSCTPIPPTRRRSTARLARPRSASTASAASSAWTTRWSAACSPAAGGCRTASPAPSSATTPTTPRARPRWSASPTCSPTTGTARASSRRSCSRRRARSELTPDALRSLMYELPYAGNGKRNVEPCPLSAREVDVLRKLAEGKVYKQIAQELEPLHEHGAHAPAQHLREARRPGPRAGGAGLHRPRLDLGRFLGSAARRTTRRRPARERHRARSRPLPLSRALDLQLPAHELRALAHAREPDVARARSLPADRRRRSPCRRPPPS